MRAEAAAPAKINLTLHVVGRREDGYHLLDSLVVFADLGERVVADPAPDWSLRVTGPMARGVPTDEGNLVLRAARLCGGAPAALTLDKRMPTASGIGGGSSDAAAALKALHRLDGRALPPSPECLGADLPVCLHGRPCRMQDIGTRLDAVPALPPLHLCLVNPGVAVPTRSVFDALRSRDNAPMPRSLPSWGEAAAFGAWIASQRNDLEPAARTLAPSIGAVIDALRATPGCLLARMSGSGATCFGLYAAAREARAAARAIADAQPEWWAAQAPVST